VPEQLVCAVNQMDLQGAAPKQPYRSNASMINRHNDSRAVDPVLGSWSGCWSINRVT
jgi:hypothetical protein